METAKHCPNCGKPLPTEGVQGLCPECLIKAGWPTRDSASPATEDHRFVPPAIDTLADSFPSLEILELIGHGGMGAVYKARQPELDRLVALKILARKDGSDPGFAERFTREARALAKLSHPHIVAVYDFGHTGDLSYFIMEYVDGTNLRQIEKTGGLQPKEALAIIPQICEALQFAHDAGVVHRDIKPENVLLDQKGNVKIADFGLAKILGQAPTDFTLTEPNHVMGTPHYMAPEQVEHPLEVDHRADIYSLGVVFYEMLTGELPLGKFDPPSRKVQVDVRLDEVVLRTLEKEPQRRYQQVSEVRTEVETIVSTAQVQPTDTESEGLLRSSLCYVSTPEYLRTFRGRFFNIYQGKGELRLDSEALSFRSGWQSVTIPLSSVRTLAQGIYPTSAKPVPVMYMAVTFEEHGISRTLLFTSAESLYPREANKIGAQWLSFLKEAVQTRTGRTLSVGHLDVAQETSWWEYLKLYLFFVATSTLGLSVIPILAVAHRLPRSFEWFIGPTFAIYLFFMCLTMPRWLGWFRAKFSRKDCQQTAATLATEELNNIRDRLRIPAIGLFLAGLIDLCFFVVLLCAEMLAPEHQPGYRITVLPVLYESLLVSIVVLTILLGASHMCRLKRYSSSVVGAFVAMLPPGALFGLPFGIWSLILLSQKDVREAFRTVAKADHPRNGKERTMRYILISAGIVVVVLVVLLAVQMNRGQSLNQFTGPAVPFRSFTAADRPLDRDIVPTPENTWLIDGDTAKTWRLFEVADPNIAARVIWYRAKIKTEELVEGAYLEMWCRFPGKGEFFSRALNNVVTGTTDWISCQTPFYLEPGQIPDLIKLNLVTQGAGKVWMQDVELITVLE